LVRLLRRGLLLVVVLHQRYHFGVSLVMVCPYMSISTRDQNRVEPRTGRVGISKVVCQVGQRAQWICLEVHPQVVVLTSSDFLCHTSPVGRDEVELLLFLLLE